jgi:ADP-dependent NAD(P)H-hydrate dehydratase
MLESPHADPAHGQPHVTRVLDFGLLRDWPLPIDSDGDKYSRGTVLVIGGSANTPGAVLLAGRAALRMGAGRLQIATDAAIVIPVGIAVPEAMVIPYEPTTSGRLTESIQLADAIVVGPGLDGEAARSMVELVLSKARSDSVVVLDAAALIVFSDIDPGFVERTRSTLVMTPNRQEVLALIDEPPADDQAALAAACVRTGAVLTSFGAVHAPDGRSWQSDVNPLGLGTSGSGDVLAGLVGGAAARCGDRAQAACWATLAHLEAGQHLEGRVGPLGYLASDLVAEIPHCLPRC